jgi:hypothetical protein
MQEIVIVTEKEDYGAHVALTAGSKARQADIDIGARPRPGGTDDLSLVARWNEPGG